MADINLTVIDPSTLDATGDRGTYDIDRFERKFLAQGDSWFSMGHFPPWATTNLLDQMKLSRSCVAVNCARPGVELAHMTDTVAAGDFLRLLTGRLAWNWDAVLFSGGGNDLIDAVPDLLLPSTQWGVQPDASRYISNAAWGTFSSHMEEVLLKLLNARDSGSINNGKPVFLHTYDYPTPRDAPAGPEMGPWLYPQMISFGIPAQDWEALATSLIEALRTMWKTLARTYAARNVVVVDSCGALAPASSSDHGVSGDWENEIHPTPHGYTLLADRWRPVLDLV